MSLGLPLGACDSHCHVFGPARRFPYDEHRMYTPEDAPKEALAAMHERLGLDRAVVVQPACHGRDNSVTLDAIAFSGGTLRGIALVADDVDVEHIAALDEGGMRGVRFNFFKHLGEPPAQSAFERIAAMITDFKWHIVLHVSPDDLDLVVPYVKPLEVPFVIDHMARIDAAGGTKQPSFQQLLDLARDERAWVKISGADRISAGGPPYHDVIPFAAALVNTAPERILWGTDWPHPNVRGLLPDERILLDVLSKAVPDADAWRRILVDNPQRLYGFDPS